ncbi:MAG: glycosyltransferase [Clostridia bacterium]|nr:glycosyltransferase [Clostridia bacterium]
MKTVQINMCSDGSTGKIMLHVAETARQHGHESETFSTHQFSVKYKKLPSAPECHNYFGSYFENAIHYILGTRVGFNGCWSFFSTARLVRKLKKIKPDILHLHNLHGFCINLPLLFGYIKKHKVKTVWTLHDCWAFTGQCPHFDMIGCEKWKTGCSECPQYNAYPKCSFDHSEIMWKKKKKWFSDVHVLVLVTPSEWLAGLVKQSFLKDYPVKVINNGIDLSVFRPVESDFRSKYGLYDEYIVLGVSFGWSNRKGLDVFCELSERLDNGYRIVLVGTDEKTEALLPEKIISIRRTDSQTELAEIYSAADLFVNPTREENYPGVNMEALACGTPVLTFGTGGSPEIINESCGFSVEKDNIDELEKQIKRICEEKPYSAAACIERARSFDMKDRYREYVELYEETAND